MSNTQEWIKLEDEKPENGSWVLLSCNYMMLDYVTAAKYEKGRFTSSITDMDMLVRSGITAWMPFPSVYMENAD